MGILIIPTMIWLKRFIVIRPYGCTPDYGTFKLPKKARAGMVFAGPLWGLLECAPYDL